MWRGIWKILQFFLQTKLDLRKVRYPVGPWVDTDVGPTMSVSYLLWPRPDQLFPSTNQNAGLRPAASSPALRAPPSPPNSVASRLREGGRWMMRRIMRGDLRWIGSSTCSLPPPPFTSRSAPARIIFIRTLPFNWKWSCSSFFSSPMCLICSHNKNKNVSLSFYHYRYFSDESIGPSNVWYCWSSEISS